MSNIFGDFNHDLRSIILHYLPRRIRNYITFKRLRRFCDKHLQFQSYAANHACFHRHRLVIVPTVRYVANPTGSDSGRDYWKQIRQMERIQELFVDNDQLTDRVIVKEINHETEELKKFKAEIHREIDRENAIQ